MKNNHIEAFKFIEKEYPTPANIGDIRWKDVASLMVAYADQFRPKWVSVEDEKPEINLPVIIYLPEAPCQFQCQIVAYDGNLFRPFSNKKRKLLKINSYYEMESITHWMPLPSPPKNESK